MFYKYFAIIAKNKDKGNNIKNSIKSIAIGGFDGMHLGHRQLFNKLCKNGALVVIQTDYANLTPKTYRSEHIDSPIYFYPLENIRSLSGEEFISLIYEEFPNLEKIVVGYDFKFGFKASSDTNDLKKLFKGEVLVVEEFKLDGISVHSRVIRDLLRKGDIKKANQLLGHEYKLSGIHINGQGLGSKQFVPTINIDVKEFLIPKEGIYATKTIINNTTYNSVTFTGHRVTTDGKFAVETHIIDENFEHNENLKKVEIIFLEKIRDNKKFEVYEELKEQILKDIEEVKDFFTSLA